MVLLKGRTWIEFHSTVPRIALFLVMTFIGLGSAASAFAQQTYYISKTTGSDTNPGTSKTAPWAHLPGMASWTGSHTPTAGETFILKGCDVWTASDLPVSWSWSGSSGNLITVGGEDQTWYNTVNCPSAWNRPVFSSGNTALSPTDVFFNMQGTNSYVVVDNIEMKGLTCTGACTGVQSYIWTASCQNCKISNNYLHGLNVAFDNAGSCTLIKSYETDFVLGTLYQGNIFDGSDRTNPSSGGVCDAFYGDYGGATIDGNVFHDIVNAIVVYASGTHPLILSRNLIYNILATNGSNHNNAIELVGGGAFYIHDNVIHDSLGESLMFGNGGETSYVWNNLWYNMLGNSPEAPQTAGQTGITSTWWNNTIVPAAGQKCIHGSGQTGGSFTAITIENTHCITTNSTAVDSTWSGTTARLNNNVLMSPSTATSQGYASSQTYPYSPSANTNGTVGAGKTICGAEVACTGSLAALANDTSYACLLKTVNGVEQVACPARTTVPRPGDVGAYQYAASTQSPNPPTGLAAVVQ